MSLGGLRTNQAYGPNAPVAAPQGGQSAPAPPLQGLNSNQNRQPAPQGPNQPSWNGPNAPQVAPLNQGNNQLGPNSQQQKDAQAQRDRLGKSLNTLNNTWLDENSVRGDGANVISDRLNFGNRKQVEGPPQVIYVPKPVTKVVYEDVFVDSPSVVDDSLNNNARSILAESQAKIALLLMENKRLHYRVAQRVQELARLRSTPVTQIVQPTTVQVVTPVVQQAPVRQVYVASNQPVIRRSVVTPVTTTAPTVIRRSNVSYATPITTTTAPTVYRTSNVSYAAPTTSVAPTVIRRSNVTYSNPTTSTLPVNTYTPTYSTGVTRVAPTTGYTTSVANSAIPLAL